MIVFNLAFLFWGEFLSLIQIFQIIEVAKILICETEVQRWKWNLGDVCVCIRDKKLC